MIHDGSRIALFGKKLGHLFHLLFTFLDTVDANVSDQGDTSTHGSSGTTLAVLDSDTLRRLDTQLLAGVQVDLGVRLAGWWIEGGGGAVDVFIWEIVVDAGLLQRGDNTWFGRGADDRHGVAGLLQTFQLLWSTWAWSGFGLELLDDFSEFTTDVLLELFLWHLEVVLLLEADQHSTEVLTDEIFKEGIDGVPLGDIVLLEQLIGEIGAGFEG